MADDILGGALSDASKATAPSAAKPAYEESELPEISDAQRNTLLGESLEAMGETMAPAERDPEQMRKKAEWEKKNREKRKAQRMARTVRGARNEPGEEQRQQRHRAGRGKRKGQAGHVDTRSKTSGSIGNAPHWRGEVEKTKKGTSTDLMSTPAGTKLAKKFHKDTINKSRKERGATELAGVQYMKTDKTMSLVEKKPSAGLSKDDKKAVVKKAKKGKDIGKKGKNFDKVAAKAAEEYGSKEAGERVAAAAMWKNMKKEHLEVLSKAKEILDEVTTVGGIGVGKMDGSANKAYDNDAKPMGKDNVTIEPVDKSLRKTEKNKKKAKKKVKVKKESFENFLDAIVTDSQK